jgi:hypothetical protein
VGKGRLSADALHRTPLEIGRGLEFVYYLQEKYFSVFGVGGYICSPKRRNDEFQI